MEPLLETPGLPEVVVVNDDPTQLTILSNVLGKANFQVHAFRNAESALAFMQNEPPKLVVTDLYMPSLDGWRFCRLLRSPEYATLNHIPILVASATYSGEEATRVTSDTGADAFCSFPLDSPRFVETAQALLKGKAPKSSPSVLIVEDDVVLADTLAASFRAHGFTAETAGTIAEADVRFRKTFHEVVVLDYHMPDGPSDVLLTSFRKLHRDAVIVMITGDPRADLALAWMREGASAYLPKPLSSALVVETCERARRERSLLRVKDLLEERTQELRESEERLGLALDAAQDGMWDWNLQTGALFFSPRCYTMLGFEVHEFPDTIGAWKRLLHPDDRGRTGRVILNHMRSNGGGFSVDFRLRNKGGHWTWLLCRGQLIARNESNSRKRLAGTLTDITAQKRAEAVMAARMRLLNLARTCSLAGLLVATLDEAEALTESQIGFYHFLEEDQVTLSLQAWSTNTTLHMCTAEGAGTHYPVDQAGVWVDAVHRRAPVIHNDYASLPHRKGLPEGHAPIVRQLVVPVLRGDAIVALLGVGNKRDPYGDQDIDAVASLADLAWDIAVSKRAEEERERLQTDLYHAQKMESIGRLAGGVAHDFNNMLGVILGHLDLLLAQSDLDSTVAESLREVQNAAQRSADLTRQLLAFARKQTISPRVLDLNEIVTSMLKMLRRLISEHIELVWRPGPSLWPIKVDPSQIDQILANLCVNARDAIREVGSIAIRTSNATIDTNFTQVSSEARPGEFVLLSVSDNGCGMDSETLDRLFEPFFTTKAVGQGTGLGLATVYGIVKQNDGFITVSSEVGHGTTFEVYLPRYRETGESLEVASDHQGAKRGHETILLVEDEPSVLRMARKMLQNQGYTVLTAATPEDALAIAESHAGSIHLLMTDVVMPGMNGRVLGDALVARHPTLKCLYMSGYAADVIADHGLFERGVGFIEKPFSAQKLAAKLREVLDA